MLFAGLFIVCLIGCYIYAIFFFSSSYLTIAITALLLAGFLKTFVQQGDKIKELEKRILVMESERADKTVSDSSQEEQDRQEEL